MIYDDDFKKIVQELELPKKVFRKPKPFGVWPMEKNAWGISIPLRFPELGPVIKNVDKVVQNVGKLSHMLTRGMLGTALGSGAGLLYSGVASDEDSSFWKPVLIGALLGGILGAASGYFMP